MRVVTQPLPRYGVAVFTTAAASVLALVLSPLSLRVPFALFAAAVVVSSLEGGLKPGLVATALSTLALGIEYWLLPLAQLPENQGEVAPLLILFVVVALLSNYLGKQCWQAVHASELQHAGAQACLDDSRPAETDAAGKFTSPRIPSPPATKKPTTTESVGAAPHPEVEGPLLPRDEPADVALLPRREAARPALPLRASRPSRTPTLPTTEGGLCGTLLRWRESPAAYPTEGERRPREDPFRALAASAPVGLLQMDTEHQCVYTNAAGQLVGGFSAEEAHGEGWTRFLHPEDRDPVVRGWTAAMDAGQEFACTCRFQTPPDKGRWVRLRSSPMYSTQGKVIGHVGVLQEIAEQKLAEEALEETRALLTAVAEGAADPLFVKDVDGRYLLTNAAGARLLGRTVPEVVGKEENQLFPAEVAGQIRAHDRQVVASGQAQTWHQVEQAPDSLRNYVIQKTPVRDDRGAVVGLISVCRDVTEAKRLRDELAEAKAALEREIQARQQLGGEQVAQLAKVTSLFLNEALARRHAEERVRETEARLQTAEAQLAELTRAHARLKVHWPNGWRANGRRSSAEPTRDAAPRSLHSPAVENIGGLAVVRE